MTESTNQLERLLSSIDAKEVAEKAAKLADDGLARTRPFGEGEAFHLPSAKQAAHVAVVLVLQELRSETIHEQPETSEDFRI